MFDIKDLDETRAPLLDHLIELRTRIIRALLALAVGFGVCLYFSNDILGFLVWPLKQAFPGGEGQLIFTQLPEVFFVQMKVALFAGFMVSFPVIANQLWAFVAPGLYAREKKPSCRSCLPLRCCSLPGPRSPISWSCRRRSAGSSVSGERPVACASRPCRARAITSGW